MEPSWVGFHQTNRKHGCAHLQRSAPNNPCAGPDIRSRSPAAAGSRPGTWGLAQDSVPFGKVQKSEGPATNKAGGQRATSNPNFSQTTMIRIPSLLSRELQAETIVMGERDKTRWGLPNAWLLMTPSTAESHAASVDTVPFKTDVRIAVDQRESWFRGCLCLEPPNLNEPWSNMTLQMVGVVSQFA